jgi:y4mF family transcriptional regulator
MSALTKFTLGMMGRLRLLQTSPRKSQKLRQDQLAGVANVGLRFIVDLEAGKPTAQIGKVLTVLAALGVTMEMKAPEARDR